MWFELLLFFIIFYLIYEKNKKKLRIIFSRNNIKKCNIEDIDEVFLPLNKNDLLAPKQNVMVNFFCSPSNFNVVGMTSDYEAWILSVLAKKSRNIFEFGTCSGKTTLLFAMNSPENAKIDTITLDEVSAKSLALNLNDNKIAQRNIINESKYSQFMFTDTNYEKKINVIFRDSKLLDVSEMKNKYDLIFIDGGHTYSCIKNDTEKSFEMIKKGGYIFWHDFSIGKNSHKDVFRYLNEISKNHDIKNIKNTSLCFLKR